MEKSAYLSLLQALYAFENEAIFQFPEHDMNCLERIYNAVLFDNPSVYYVDKSIKCRIMSSRYTVEFNYLYTFKQISELNLELAKIIFKLITSQTSDDFMKEKIIHDYLAKNITYNNIWSCSGNQENFNIIGALIKKKAVCEGISKACKFLCDAAGIKNIVVSGTAWHENLIRENHAWNIVKINGMPYHLDATWDMPNPLFMPVQYDYFNINDDKIKKDHEWDKKFYPQCK